MSNCIIPNWNLRHQRQEQAEAEEEFNRTSHVQNLHNTPSYIVPLSNNGVTELTWENGQPAMHGPGGIVSFTQICEDELGEETGSCFRRLGLPTASTKPTWENMTSDSLESIVHQATCHNQNIDLLQQQDQNEVNGSSSMVACGKWGEKTGHTQMPPGPAGLLKKRMRSEPSDQCGRYFSCANNIQEEHAERSSTCASASATFCRDNDHTNMMTWPPSSGSPIHSVKTKTMDEDSACRGGSENKNGENDTKGETIRSQITRSSRAAAIHNQSERRRRDRINQKMKALQKLVPNASKTDKASMLDEVIAYLKQLQAQIHMMSARSMPQMMMPPPGIQQQHLHMSQLLARMGMAGVGVGPMGMLDMNNMARTAPHPSLPSLIHPATMTAAAATFAPPVPFVVPPGIPTRPPSQANAGATNSSVPYNDPYYAFLAQSMNLEFYNKMAALFQQQANQSLQTPSNSPQANLVKRE